SHAVFSRRGARSRARRGRRRSSRLKRYSHDDSHIHRSADLGTGAARAGLTVPTIPDDVPDSAFEQKIDALRTSGQQQGSAHLYVGQEAVATGVCARLNAADYVASTHRGHGHAIGKGVDVARMMAELYGRATGTNKGKGGSMHIADTSAGMLGGTGTVGAGTPIALGAALSARTRKTQQVAVAFFGDGAMGQGTVYECLN